MGRRPLSGLGLLILALCAGCAPAPRKPAPAAVPPAAAAPVDEAAQRSDYERGLRFFGREQYVEARAAWREAVRRGPRTPVGRKAQEHLRKLDQMLTTL